MATIKGKLHPLFPHQVKILDGVRRELAAENNRPMVCAATGVGKTVIAAHMVAGILDRGKRVLFIAPYISLINQTAKSFMDQGIPQPGIIQADHPWTNYGKRLQIASVQTLDRRVIKGGVGEDNEPLTLMDDPLIAEMDVIIVDEAHVQYAVVKRIMDETDKIVIGLSATPFSKGLGKMYNALVKGPPMRWLINAGFLSDYIAYSQDKPDLTGIKIQGGEYNEGQLGDRMSNATLVGCIVETWLKRGENRPTVCFCVTVAHAEFVGSEFERVGVTCVVITAHTDIEDRERYFRDFDIGKIKILINVGTLVAGLDRDVRCIIDGAPVRSEARHVQKSGRGLRSKDNFFIPYLDYIDNRGDSPEQLRVLFKCSDPDDVERVRMVMSTMHDGRNNDAFGFDTVQLDADITVKVPKIKKDHCLVLDHAGNWLSTGPGLPDEISIDSLCDGKKKTAAEKKKEKAEKKEKAPKECPACHYVKRAGEHTCSQCGFTPKFIENVEVIEGELVEIVGSKVKRYNREDKQRIYSELLGYQKERSLMPGKKPLSDGWVSNTYRDMVGVWPKGLDSKISPPGGQVKGFIMHKNIKFAKGKNKK